MLDYNVPGGKLNRGMAVYDVLVALKGADVSPVPHQRQHEAWCWPASTAPSSPVCVLNRLSRHVPGAACRRARRA